MGIVYNFLKAIVVILLAYAVATEFERIAEMKGYSKRRYFWWSFLLPPLGYAMVLSLPDRGGDVAFTHWKATEEELKQREASFFLVGVVILAILIPMLIRSV